MSDELTHQDNLKDLTELTGPTVQWTVDGPSTDSLPDRATWSDMKAPVLAGLYNERFLLICDMVEAIRKIDRRVPLLRAEVIEEVGKDVYRTLVKKGILNEQNVWIYNSKHQRQEGVRKVCWISAAGIKLREKLGHGG